MQRTLVASRSTPFSTKRRKPRSLYRKVDNFVRLSTLFSSNCIVHRRKCNVLPGSRRNCRSNCVIQFVTSLPRVRKVNYKRWNDEKRKKTRKKKRYRTRAASENHLPRQNTPPPPSICDIYALTRSWLRREAKIRRRKPSFALRTRSGFYFIRAVSNCANCAKRSGKMTR